MDAPQAATQVEDVVRGFVALVMLRWGNEAAARDMASAVKTQIDGTTCDIAWQASADEVWRLVSQAADEWEKRHRDRRSGGQAGCPACGKSGCAGCSNDGDSPKLKGEAEKPLRDDEF